MSRPRPKLPTKIPSISIVSPDTRFYIDYDWWQASNRSLQSYLQTSLGNDITIENSVEDIDLIDSKTGEVKQVSGFEFTVQRILSELPTNYMERLSLIDRCFFTLLRNGNRPMTISELSEEVGRDPDTIIRTLKPPRVYRGLRPFVG